MSSCRSASLFEAPSVAGLSGVLSGGGALPARLMRGERPPEIPLSYAQRRLWFLNRLEGPSGTYVIPLAVRLKGRLEVAALEGALNDVVERHESLRTVFPDRLGVPRQEILAGASARVGLEMSRLSEAELSEAVRQACGRGFDVSRELPLRAHLYVLGEAEQVLLVVLHHIAGDGWSLRPLLRDLAEFYRARVGGDAARLPVLPVQYADYTLWQRQVLGEETDSGSVLARQLSYWRDRLEGLPEQIELPAARARPAVSSHRGGSIGFSIDAALHGGLIRVGRECGASLFMVLQALVAGLLTRLGAGTDVALGSPIAGRSDAAVEELVGFFVNTLVLRTDTSGHPSVRELIGRVRSGNLAAYSHQDVPFERLVEDLNPSRSLSRHPLFQVMLAHQPAEAGAFEFAGLEASVEAVSTSSAKFDLAVSVSERRGRNGGGLGIAGVIEYSSDLFDRDQIEVLGARLVRVLEGAVADADRGCICCRSCRVRSGPPSWRSGTRRRGRCHLRRCRSCSRRRHSARPKRLLWFARIAS
jgi:hypothetical protein